MADQSPRPAAPMGVRSVELQTDASILDAVGRGHTLASALADLIDNSIDAGATRVSIQFVTKDSMIRSIRTRDDGCGMTEGQLVDAVTLGRRREYDADSLGHFGVGLKSASLSQADVLTVFSASGYAPAAGVRLGKDQAGSSIVADVFDSEIATTMLRRRGIAEASGTLVEWTHLRAVSVATSVQDRRRWIESAITLIRDELGLVFHRRLSEKRIRIELEEFDETMSASGAPRVVKPIDPFGFERWGMEGYPKTLRGELPSGADLVATCFILPPGVNGGVLDQSRRARQGLYVYRHGRLLHAGGWLGLVHDLPSELQLARVVLDLTDDVLDAVTINPEKRGVVLRPQAVQALERSVTDGLTLRRFWDDSRDVWKGSQRRESRAKPFAPLGNGVPAEIGGIVERTIGVREDGGVSLSFAWSQLPYAQLFAFEPPTGVVRLNQEHRAQLEGDGAKLDFVKTSLFFLLEPHVGKEWLGSAATERIDAMQAALALSIVPQLAEPPPDDAVRESHMLDEQLAVLPAVIRDSDSDEPLSDPHVAHVHVTPEGLDDFMRHIRRMPLLTAEEEVELARQIEVGQLAEERLLSLEDPADPSAVDLVTLQHEGRMAFERMILSNVRLVVSIAKKHQWNGLDLADLVQEGNAGLVQAVRKFDYRLGNRFSTYATWWIRQAVTRAIADQGRAIRFPVHVVDKLPEIKKAWARAPGSATQRIHIVADERSESAGAIRAVVNNLNPPVSLESSIYTQADSGSWQAVPLAEVLVDTEAFSTHDQITAVMLRWQLNQVLDTLAEREAGVIRMRFGLDGPRKTLDQIGEMFGVTRERIRQIEKKAMESLRGEKRARILRDYLGDQVLASEPGGPQDGADGAEAPHGRAAAKPRRRRASKPAAEGIESGRTTLLTISSQPPENLQEWPHWKSVVVLYGAGSSIADMSTSVGVGEDEIAGALAQCILGLRFDAEEASRTLGDGAPWPTLDVERIRRMYEQGWSVDLLAAGFGRTQLAVARQLLDGPGRPHLTRKMLASVRSMPTTRSLALTHRNDGSSTLSAGGGSTAGDGPDPEGCAGESSGSDPNALAIDWEG